MVMELLGPSLEDLFNFCNRRFTLKTVLMLVDQMLVCVENLHQNHFVHRDLKPDNFVMGRGLQTNKVNKTTSYFIRFFLLFTNYQIININQHLVTCCHFIFKIVLILYLVLLGLPD